jgi:hypothetical protein
MSGAVHAVQYACLLSWRLMYRIVALVMLEEVEEEAFGIVTGYTLGEAAS